METSFSISVPTEFESVDGNRSTRNILYEFGIKNQNSSNYDDFKLQITDPSDPGFLFDYKMSVTDFSAIKSELSLRCDFLTFPESLKKLLLYCTQKDNWKSIIIANGKRDPIFYIEVTTDINLVRPMKLNIIKASDARLNEYLTAEVIKFKSLCIESQKKLKEMQSHIEEHTEQTQTMNKQMKEQYEEKMKSILEEKDRIINECESKQRLMKSQYTNELKTIEESHNKQFTDETQKMNEKINILTQNLRQLEKEKLSLVAKTERQTERIQNLEAQNEEMKQNLLRKEEGEKQATNSLMDTSKKEAALKSQNEHLLKENSQIKNQIGLLNQQLHTQEELVASLRDAITGKAKENQELLQIKVSFDNLTKEHEFLKDKSREIITKISKQLNGYKEECEEKEDDLEEAEQTIEEYKEKIYTINQMYAELRKQNSNLEFQLRTVINEKDDISKKLNASEMQVDSLAKQIDQQAFALRPKLFSQQFSPSNSTSNFDVPQFTEVDLSQTNKTQFGLSDLTFTQSGIAKPTMMASINDEYEYEYEEDEEEESENFSTTKNEPVDLMAAFRS